MMLLHAVSYNLRQLVKMNSKMFPSTIVDELGTVLRDVQLCASSFASCGGSFCSDLSLLQ